MKEAWVGLLKGQEGAGKRKPVKLKIEVGQGAMYAKFEERVALKVTPNVTGFGLWDKERGGNLLWFEEKEGLKQGDSITIG